MAGDWQQTACILCSINCGIEVQLDGRHLARIRGDKAHPGSQGYTCEKQARLDHYQNGKHRLSSPQPHEPSPPPRGPSPDDAWPSGAAEGGKWEGVVRAIRAGKKSIWGIDRALEAGQSPPREVVEHLYRRLLMLSPTSQGVAP